MLRVNRIGRFAGDDNRPKRSGRKRARSASPDESESGKMIVVSGDSEAEGSAACARPRAAAVRPSANGQEERVKRMKSASEEMKKPRPAAGKLRKSSAVDCAESRCQIQVSVPQEKHATGRIQRKSKLQRRESVSSDRARTTAKSSPLHAPRASM